MKFTHFPVAAAALVLISLSACATIPPGKQSPAASTGTSSATSPAPIITALSASAGTPVVYSFQATQIQTIYVFSPDGDWTMDTICGALYQRNLDSIRATGTPSNPNEQRQYFTWRNTAGAPCSATVGPRDLLKVCPSPLPFITLSNIASEQRRRP